MLLIMAAVIGLLISRSQSSSDAPKAKPPLSLPGVAGELGAALKNAAGDAQQHALPAVAALERAGSAIETSGPDGMALWHIVPNPAAEIELIMPEPGGHWIFVGSTDWQNENTSEFATTFVEVEK